MSTCKDKNRHSDGYETWQSSKNMKRKTTTPKRVVPDDDDNDCGEQGPSFPLVAKPTPMSGNKIKKKQKEVAPRASSGSGRTRTGKGRGMVVITEKEYCLLLSLKKNMKTPSDMQSDIHGKPKGMASSHFEFHNMK